MSKTEEEIIYTLIDDSIDKVCKWVSDGRGIKKWLWCDLSSYREPVLTPTDVGRPHWGYADSEIITDYARVICERRTYYTQKHVIKCPCDLCGKLTHGFCNARLHSSDSSCPMVIPEITSHGIKVARIDAWIKMIRDQYDLKRLHLHSETVLIDYKIYQVRIFTRTQNRLDEELRERGITYTIPGQDQDGDPGHGTQSSGEAR